MSEEIFWVMCKRIAKDVYPEDVDGIRFNDVCGGEGDASGALSSPQAGRMRALVDRRTQIVAALDQVFGDALSAGAATFGDDEITVFLGEIVPFYDPPDELLPAASDAIAAVLLKLIDPLTADGKAVDASNRDAQRAQAVLEKFEAVAKRKGYRPSNRTLGFLHPILTYPGLDEVGKSLLGFVGEGGGGHDAQVALLKAAALELAEEAEPADPEDPERLKTTLHSALGLLLDPDDTLAEEGQGPAWVLKRGPDGRALAKAGMQGAAATPFPVPGRKDDLGRGPLEPAADMYEFVDASRTALAGAMREAKAIVERGKGDKPSTLDGLMRGLRPIMGPTSARTYDFAGKPYAFQGPDLGQGAVLDLVHAAGVLATYPEVADAIELVIALLDKHEAAAAGPVAVALNINDRADEHPEAVLMGFDGKPETPSEFWDDVLGVAQRMAKREGMLEALVKSFADPASADQGKLFGTWMRYKDDAPYVGEPIVPDGPGPADFGGAYTPEQKEQMNAPIEHIYSELVDRSQPDVGMNRSIWQRTMSLINALNGVRVCNPQGSSLTVGVELLGSLKFPSAADYTECEAIDIQDAVEIYSKAVAGRARLDVKDASALLLGAAGAPLGLVKGVAPGSPFGAIFEAYTDIAGLTDAPSAPAMARFIYAPRNDFLETLMGPSQLTRDGVPIETYEPHAMFHLENGQDAAGGQSFLKVGVPLVTAFDDTELREADVLGAGKLLDGYMFGELLSTFHRHWSSRLTTSCEVPIAAGNEGCTQSLDPSAPFYARQSNLVSYEPLLIESLIDEDLTGVLHRAAAEVQTVTVNGKNGLKILGDLAKRLLTPEPALTYRDGRKFAYTNTCVVPPGTVEPPASCGCPEGTSEADEKTCALPGGGSMPRGRIIEGGVPPLYLVLDALKKVDQAFLGENKARLDPWHAARSNLADQFLAGDLDAASNSYRMRNQRARFMGIKIFRWVLGRIAEHKTAGDLATWGPDLANRFEKTFSHPLIAGGLDLLDKFWEDKEAAKQFAAISAHIMDPAKNPQGFENFLVALADTLTLVDREPDITPLVQFASLLVAPNAFEALDKGSMPNVETGAAYLGLEVSRSVMGVDENPERSAISKLLNNLVLPTSTGEAPAEILFDMIAEINRRDPKVSGDVPLATGDQRAVFDQTRQFMVDVDHGLKRLYSVIQNRKVHP